MMTKQHNKVCYKQNHAVILNTIGLADFHVLSHSTFTKSHLPFTQFTAHISHTSRSWLPSCAVKSMVYG